jgi:hypothetical protein
MISQEHSLIKLRNTRAVCAVVHVTSWRNKLISTMHENCALLGCYATSVGNSPRTFRDNLSDPSTWVKFLFKLAPLFCPETSVGNYQYPLRNSPEERSSHSLRGGSYCFSFHETRLCSANFVTNCTDFHAIMAESFYRWYWVTAFVFAS